MDVTLGSNPSYTWRSIIAGREILKLGGRIKCIGDGSFTRIISYPWVLGTKGFEVHSLSNEITSETLVIMLIDQVIGGWNEQVIIACFSPYETKKKICVFHVLMFVILIASTRHTPFLCETLLQSSLGMLSFTIIGK